MSLSMKIIIIILFNSISDSLSTNITTDEANNRFVCATNYSQSVINDGPQTRQRVRQEVTLEIGLFYDHTFASYHGRDAMDMMRVVMRQTQLVFQYPSLRTRVNLVVTRVTPIKQRELNSTYLVFEYYPRFCPMGICHALEQNT